MGSISVECPATLPYPVSHRCPQTLFQTIQFWSPVWHGCPRTNWIVVLSKVFPVPTASSTPTRPSAPPTSSVFQVQALVSASARKLFPDRQIRAAHPNSVWMRNSLLQRRSASGTQKSPAWWSPSSKQLGPRFHQEPRQLLLQSPPKLSCVHHPVIQFHRGRRSLLPSWTFPRLLSTSCLHFFRKRLHPVCWVQLDGRRAQPQPFKSLWRKSCCAVHPLQYPPSLGCSPPHWGPTTLRWVV